MDFRQEATTGQFEEDFGRVSAALKWIMAASCLIISVHTSSSDQIDCPHCRALADRSYRARTLVCTGVQWN